MPANLSWTGLLPTLGYGIGGAGQVIRYPP